MNANRTKILRKTKKCSNHQFLLEQLKSYSGVEKTHAKNKSLGFTIWKVMLKIAWKDAANWLVKRLTSCTKSQLHAWTTVRAGDGWRIAKSMLCLKMLVFFLRNGRLDILCTSCHKMDSSL